MSFPGMRAAKDAAARITYRLWLRGRAVTAVDPKQLSVGRHSYGVLPGTLIFHTGRERLSIGSFCSIAPGVLFVFGEHPTGLVSTFPFRTLFSPVGGNVDATDRGEIRIGNDVWIGTRATILSGVRSEERRVGNEC